MLWVVKMVCTYFIHFIGRIHGPLKPCCISVFFEECVLGEVVAAGGCWLFGFCGFGFFFNYPT